MSKYKSTSFLSILLLGILVRLFLINKTALRYWLQNRVEISTPLTSWSRVLEGVYLRNTVNVSSYEGDLVHEIPLMLQFYSLIITLFADKIIYFFILVDSLNSILIYTISFKIISYLCVLENFNITSGKYAKYLESAKKSENFLLTEKNFSPTFWSTFALTCYLFNPLNIACCMSQSTVLVHNFVLLLWLNFLLNSKVFMAYLLLALHANITVYSFILIVPSISFIRQKFYVLKRKSLESNSRLILKHFLLFTSLVALVFGLNFYIEKFDTRFISCTYLFTLKVTDLVPNMGLFWYFFTEMFDHFLTFFTFVFQLNAFLYSVPLTLRLKNDPIINILLQIGFIYVFKSYPNIGETGFYTSLLPCLAYLFPLMRNVLVYSCMLIAAGVLAPIMFYLWLGSGGGNANFYFAITLVYSIGQIFLLVDVLYANLKREFIKMNGSDLPKNKDGSLANFSLE